MENSCCGLVQDFNKNPGSYAQRTGAPAKLLNFYLSGRLFFTRIFFYELDFFFFMSEAVV